MRSYHYETSQYRRRLAVAEGDVRSKSGDGYWYCAAAADKHGGVERYDKLEGNRRVVLEEDIGHFELHNSLQQSCR